MSDTPRSDAQKRGDFVHICFARELERENTALKAALDHQMNYQRELRADRDRLDWLGSHQDLVEYWWGKWYSAGEAFTNFRAAIDAAIGEGKP